MGGSPPGSAGVPPAPFFCKQDASHRHCLRLCAGLAAAGRSSPRRMRRIGALCVNRRQSGPAGAAPGPMRAGRPRSRGARPFPEANPEPNQQRRLQSHSFSRTTPNRRAFLPNFAKGSFGLLLPNFAKRPSRNSRITPPLRGSRRSRAEWRRLMRRGANAAPCKWHYKSRVPDHDASQMSRGRCSNSTTSPLQYSQAAAVAEEGTRGAPSLRASQPRHARISLTIRGSWVEVSFSVRPLRSKKRSSWCRPSRCRMVACQSATLTGFSTAR